ncbi:MAG: general stress protein CsbD [Bacteroidales bacterium]|nr:general stress protein CsbD [Bacteroidales bacterium]
MNPHYNQQSLDELKLRLKKKYPKLTDTDLRTSENNEKDMLRIVAYKLGKTKEEMSKIIEEL